MEWTKGQRDFNMHKYIGMKTLLSLVTVMNANAKCTWKNLAGPDLEGNLHYAAKITTLRNRTRLIVT